MKKSWNIKEILDFTSRFFKEKGLDNPRLEAEVLLADVLKEDRIYLYSHFDTPLNQQETDLYHKHIVRRCSGEPVAYITGHKEFMSLDFAVNEYVLIPRPETELLVEHALELIVKNYYAKVCDVGTGSGVIPISIAHYLPKSNLKICAVDISAEALNVAAQNALRYNKNIEFYQSDLLASTELKQHKFDLITANLPYIPEGQFSNLPKSVKNYEPKLALLAGKDGLDLYRRLVPQAYSFLNPGGTLLLEIDSGQVGPIKAILTSFIEVKIYKDLSGRDRLVEARRE